MFKKLREKFRIRIWYYDTKYGFSSAEYEKYHFYFYPDGRNFTMPNIYIFHAMMVFLYKHLKWRSKFGRFILNTLFKFKNWLENKSINYYVKKYGLLTEYDRLSILCKLHEEHPDAFIDKELRDAFINNIKNNSD